MKTKSIKELADWMELCSVSVRITSKKATEETGLKRESLEKELKANYKKIATILRERQHEDELKFTREQESAIDKKLGGKFKKEMKEFAKKLQDLMVEFPMAQGSSQEAKYLQQPFDFMSKALHLVSRFGMSEKERDKDDAVISAIPKVLDKFANVLK